MSTIDTTQTAAATGLLDEAFKNAKMQVLESDNSADQITPAEAEKLVQKVLAYYQKNREVTDAAVKALQGLEGHKNRDAHHASLLELETPEARQQAIQDWAEAALKHEDLAPVSEAANSSGIAGLGLGLSAGAAFFIGAGGGAEAIWGIDDNSFRGRGFTLASLGIDFALNAGYTLGIWTTLPAIGTTKNKGIIVDILIPELALSLRFMVVCDKDWELLGYTIMLGKLAGMGAALYRGTQYVIGMPSKRANLKVWNVTNEDGWSNAIGQGELAELLVCLYNTSGMSITIAEGDRLNISMPDYFTASEVSNMEVELSGWGSQGSTGNTITIVNETSGGITLSGSDYLRISVNNVLANSGDADPEKSDVSVTIPQAQLVGGYTDVPGMAASAVLTLVPVLTSATLNWSAIVPDFGFLQYAPASGTDLTITSQANSSDILGFTSVAGTDSNGEAVYWILGYQYYVGDNQQPLFRPAWKEDDKSIIPGKTFYAPNWIVVTSEGQDTAAYYDNTVGGANYLQVTDIKLVPED